MHDAFYLNLNLTLTLIVQHAPLGQEPSVIQSNQDETRDSYLLAIFALQSRLPAFVTSSWQSQPL